MQLIHDDHGSKTKIWGRAWIVIVYAMGIWYSLPKYEIMNELKGFLSLSWSLKMGLGEAIVNWAIGISSLIKLLRLIWGTEKKKFVLHEDYVEILFWKFGKQIKYEINMGG